MDMLELIRARRSVRKFEDRSVEPELIEKVLEAGRWAPSGLNNQPWRFGIITDPALIEKLSLLTRYERIVRSAAVLIPVFLDVDVSYNRTKDLQAVGACLQNMLLEIHSLGLGAVWLGEILKSGDRLREILGLPGSLELMAVLALGYPAELPAAAKRKELKDLIVFRR
jgi:nitroreductase